LAWATLQHDQVTNTDEVARDGDGISRVTSTWLDEADTLTNAIGDTCRAGLWTRDDHLLLAIMVVVMMMEGMKDLISCTFNAAAEAVVVPVVVVVTHIVSGGSVGSANFFLGNFDVLARSLATVLDFVSRVDTAAVFALGDIDLRLVGLVSCIAVVDVDLNSGVFGRTVVAG
jgi:hypothetical protein